MKRTEPWTNRTDGISWSNLSNLSNQQPWEFWLWKPLDEPWRERWVEKVRISRRANRIEKIRLDSNFPEMCMHSAAPLCTFKFYCKRMCTGSVLNRILEQHSENKQTAYPFSQVHQNECLRYTSSWETSKWNTWPCSKILTGTPAYLSNSPWYACTLLYL